MDIRNVEIECFGLRESDDLSKVKCSALRLYNIFCRIVGAGLHNKTLQMRIGGIIAEELNENDDRIVRLDFPDYFNYNVTTKTLTIKTIIEDYL